MPPFDVVEAKLTNSKTGRTIKGFSLTSSDSKVAKVVSGRIETIDFGATTITATDKKTGASESLVLHVI